MLLALLPLAGVHVLVCVCHDSFALAETVRPVTVIHTNSSIDHFADTILLVVLPTTDILILWGYTLLIGLCEVLVGTFLTLADL